MVSKIASANNKPRKLSWIWAGQEREFLKPLPLKAMPGIGPKTVPKLERLGISTLGELAEIPFETMWQMMGGYGIHLWERARGIDRRTVSAENYKRKSISEEKTYPIDIDSQDLLIKEAEKMLKDLCYRLRKDELFAKTITLKIRYKDFQTYTHQRSIEKASNLPNDFLDPLRQLFKKRDHKRRVRLIGLGLSHLQNEVQLEMFGSNGFEPIKRYELEQTLDKLRGKYGGDVI